jgi:hypothetical protein
MIDSRLCNMYKTYFKDALAVLEASTPHNNQPIPLFTEDRIEIKPTKRITAKRSVIEYKVKKVIKNDYRRFIDGHYTALMNLASCKTLLKYLENKRYLRQPLEKQGFLLSVLIDYCAETNKLYFIDNKFKPIYAKIEEYIFSEEIQYSCSAYLVGLTIDAKMQNHEIRIDEYTKIRKCSKKEYQHVLQKIYTKYNDPIKPRLYKIEIIFYKKKENRCNYARKQLDILESVLLLLRLFKTSNIKMYDRKIEELPFRTLL